MRVYHSLLETSVVPLRVFTCEDELLAIGLGSRSRSRSGYRSLRGLESWLRRFIPNTILTPAGDRHRQIDLELSEYFAGRRRVFDLPLRLLGTEFQKDVWRAVDSIPYGATSTYRDIAQLVGRPKATRAVGAANGRNPLPIVIPCHRVVGADGTLTGYGGGLPLKRRLLAIEGVLPSPSVQMRLFDTHSLKELS
jgi:O-6-methylguanine DNA methyltransferase